MTNAHRLSMIAIVIVCFVGVQANVTLFASESTSSTETQPSASQDVAPATSNDSLPAMIDTSLTPLPEPARLTLDTGFLAPNQLLSQDVQRLGLEPVQASALAGQIYQGRPHRMGRNGSIAAIMIGAAATITGAALLIYANRPDCTINQFAGGCGYGTKVIGGSVLAGGVVGLFVGALTWR